LTTKNERWLIQTENDHANIFSSSEPETGLPYTYNVHRFTNIKEIITQCQVGIGKYIVTKQSYFCQIPQF